MRVEINRSLDVILTFPGLFIILLFWTAPLIVLFVTSFFTNIPGGSFLNNFTLDNYKIFADPFYFGIVVKTAIIGAVVTIMSLIISFPVSYKLSRMEKGKASFFLVLIVVPFLTAIIFRVFGLVYVFGNNGIINSFLDYLGIEKINLIWNRGSIVMGFLNVLLPYTIMSLYSSINQIDISLEEAAYSLGANKIKTIWYVVLPLVKPGIVTGGIFVFGITMGTFEVPSILGGKEGMVMSMLIQLNVARINYPVASSLSCVLLIFVVGVVVISTKFFGGELKL